MSTNEQSVKILNYLEEVRMHTTDETAEIIKNGGEVKKICILFEDPTNRPRETLHCLGYFSHNASGKITLNVHSSKYFTDRIRMVNAIFLKYEKYLPIINYNVKNIIVPFGRCKDKRNCPQ